MEVIQKFKELQQQSTRSVKAGKKHNSTNICSTKSHKTYGTMESVHVMYCVRNIECNIWKKFTLSRE